MTLRNVWEMNDIIAEIQKLKAPVAFLHYWCDRTRTERSLSENTEKNRKFISLLYQYSITENGMPTSVFHW